MGPKLRSFHLPEGGSGWRLSLRPTERPHVDDCDLVGRWGLHQRRNDYRLWIARALVAACCRRANGGGKGTNRLISSRSESDNDQFAGLCHTTSIARSKRDDRLPGL